MLTWKLVHSIDIWNISVDFSPAQINRLNVALQNSHSWSQNYVLGLFWSALGLQDEESQSRDTWTMRQVPGLTVRAGYTERSRMSLWGWRSTNDLKAIRDAYIQEPISAPEAFKRWLLSSSWMMQSKNQDHDLLHLSSLPLLCLEAIREKMNPSYNQNQDVRPNSRNS